MNTTEQTTNTTEQTTTTWTFFGHWENDEIVVEYVTPGVVEDTRTDTGYWAEGLWAASGTGATPEEAEANAKAEYENDEESPNDERAGHAASAIEAVYAEGEPLPPLTPESDEWWAEKISDLLADLRHLSDRVGVDFGGADDRAYTRYLEEREEDR